MSIVETVAADAAKTAVGGAASGSLLPWLLLGAVLVVGGAAAGGYAYGHHVEALAFDAFKSQQTAVAEKELADAQADARQKEQVATSKMAFTDASYQTQLQTLQDQNHDLQQTETAAVVALHNGTLRLRYVSAGTGGASGNQITAAATGSDAAGASGPTAELPVPVGGFLLAESARADELAVLDAGRAQRVTALQAIVTQDRQTCNGVAP